MELSGTNCCIPKDRQSRNCGYRFSEKFDLFPSQLRKIEEQPGNIPSGTSEVLSPSVCHGIVFEVDANDLYLLRIFVDEGRTLKRFKARSHGRAAPRLKRSSHITAVVEEKGA